MSKLIPRIMLVTWGLIALLAYAWPVQAQTPTPREALIQAIQERARRDVESNLPHETPTDLDVLFGEEAHTVGMSMNEVAGVYDIAYQAASDARSPLEELKGVLQPNVGWFVALILAAWLLFKNVVNEYMTQFFKRIGTAIYQNFSGFRPFWMFSLQRYRAELVRNYGELKLPFRSDRPLRMDEVYVPLRVLGSTDRNIVDASVQLQTHERLIVAGTPGSGKTMLLRHLALTYAQRRLKASSRQPIPVLLELNRLDNSEISLRQHLVDSLARNGFPDAFEFIQVFLKRKDGLLLLLDGLDEVSIQSRIRVVEQIRNLMTECPNAHFVITCRTQVYRHEFDDKVTLRLEIVEFNDQQIRRFLNSWEPHMPKEEGKSVEHFMRELHERPRIMALARNPLLLSMIAYLYTDTNFVLPFSRTEFYESSTTLLLDKWHGERNHYKANEKRIVLQGLALFIHSGRSGVDRRYIAFTEALTTIRYILPRIALKDEDARPMLDEIVERSGLLLAVDGGIFYQFSHLTLQEFFSSLALKNGQNLLLNFFDADRDAWREVVRLWCGLEHDSTELIRTIFAKDQLLAFECLGAAQQVESSYADWLIDLFKNHLDDALKFENLAHALALVAANPRSRGAALFAFLINCLSLHNNELAAAYILSLTNLPKAAKALASYANEVVEIRPYLVSMGDLAVPVLTGLPDRSQDWVFDALSEISTPVSLLALVGLMWDEEKTVTYKAAWRSLALFKKNDFKEHLRSVSLTSKQQREQYLKWVWDPFDELNDSSLPLIAGRCIYLLDNVPYESIPKNEPSVSSFDPKLVVALAIAKKEQTKYKTRKISLSRIKIWLFRMWQSLRGKRIEETDLVLKFTLDGIETDIRNRLMSLLETPQFTTGNWRKPPKSASLSKRSLFNFDSYRGWGNPFRLIMIPVFLINLASAIVLYLGSIQQEIPDNGGWGWLLWAFMGLVPMGNLRGGFFIFPQALESVFYRKHGLKVFRAVLFPLDIAFAILMAYCPTMLLNYWGYHFGAVVFGLIIIACLLYSIAYITEFINTNVDPYMNPLQELIIILRMK